MQQVAIIDYGAGNVKSVELVFRRFGIQTVLTSDPEQIRAADKVVFPGVGEASSAMEKLRELGLDTLIPALKQPVFGICLGMQLLCEFTEEGNATGLGIFPLTVKRFPSGKTHANGERFKVPHVGWDISKHIEDPMFKGLKEEFWTYFVHSYYVPDNPFAVAKCDYIVNFASALHKDNFYAVQFHPERSSKEGEKIIQNFLEL